MFRPATRLVFRQSFTRNVTARSFQRSIGTAPAAKSRSWKNSALRLGTAGAVVWFYNTSDVFADTPSLARTVPVSHDESEQLPTIETLAEEKRKRATEAQKDGNKASSVAVEAGEEVNGAAGVEGLEEEAEQEGAFNPETGEINWDCPCLGGMAHGPCGDEFKSAFSCFVYSNEEPKGMDCIDKFKGMQDCFRQYPEIYGSELHDEDDMSEANSDIKSQSKEAQPLSNEEITPSEQSQTSTNTKKVVDEKPSMNKSTDHLSGIDKEHPKESNSKPGSEQDPVSDEVPEKWHDQRSQNASSS